MKFEEEAVKKLCSAAYQYKYKKTLLKIMAMPLMAKVVKYWKSDLVTLKNRKKCRKTRKSHGKDKSIKM